MNSREIDLLKLNFEKNEHQRSFQLSKYDSTWYVDFWKISDYTEHKWSILIEDIKYDLEMVKKQYFDDLRQHPAYQFRAKEIKRQILNKLNHYKSNLQEETKVKLNRLANKEKIRELEIRIETLKELMNGK
jgi:hypothetical protein